MARALEQNRPAYIKIAFPGVEEVGVLNITDRVKHFKHFVLEGGRGRQFEFEIINPDEKLEEILKEQSSFLYDDVDITPKTKINSLVLVEWGYLGGNGTRMKSKVHSGHIVSVKYSFRSGQEKTIKVEVADTPAYFSQYTQGSVTAKTQLQDGTGKLKKHSTILSELIESLLSKIPKVKGVVDLSDASKNTLDASNRFSPDGIAKGYQIIPDFPQTFSDTEEFLNSLDISTGTEEEIDYSPGKAGGLVTGNTGEVKPASTSKQQAGALDATPDALLNTGGPSLDTPPNIAFTTSDTDPSMTGKTSTSAKDLLAQQVNGKSPARGYTLTVSGVEVRTTATGSPKVDDALVAINNDIVNASQTANEEVLKAHTLESNQSTSEPSTASTPSDAYAKLTSPQGEPLLYTLRNLTRKISNFFTSPAQEVNLSIVPEGLVYSRDAKIEDVLKAINNDLESKSPESATRAVFVITNSLNGSRDKIISAFGRDAFNALKDSTEEDLKIKSFPQLGMSNPRNLKLDYGGKDSIITNFKSTQETAYMLKALIKPSTTNVISDVYSFLFNKEALLSIENTLAEASKAAGHKTAPRDDLSKWSSKNNSVTNVDTADFKYLENTLDLIANLRKYVEDSQIPTVLSKLSESEGESFTRLQERLSVVADYRELLGITDSIASYFVESGTTFDNVNGGSVMGRLIGSHIKNREEVLNRSWTINIETLGIPELDETFNIGSGASDRSRRVYFKAHDVTREKYSNQEELHWLTGQYMLNAISHTITPSKGYVTTMELIRSAY